MKIRPLYDRIVVKRIEEKATMKGGLFIPDSAKEKPQEGEVVAVGKGKRLEDGKSCRSTCSLATASCSASIPAATSSWMAMSYLIMREDEVLGILEAQPQVAKKAS
jgi:chaperonin GroES